MMRRILERFLESQAIDSGRFIGTYRRLCRPDGHAWARYLKEQGVLYEMGEHCYISPYANITDPVYLRLGDNVRLSECTILGHDGSVNMLNRAYGVNLDHVGPVTIRDNVFVSHGAIILPGVTIGPNAIVGAGTVVARDVKEGEVVSGVPAKVVSRIEMSLGILQSKNEKLPWRELIEKRGADFDPDLEPELIRRRQEHFFGEARHRG